MIFHKDPIVYDAWVDQPDLDETLLAFAVAEKVHMIMAIAHPLQQDPPSETAALVCKQFIQDRFLQFSTWMPQKAFSWSEALAKLLSEIKHWVTPKESTSYGAISQMIWFNWLVIVHPRSAFLISIGEIHTLLLRQKEWQSWWEVPVDYAVSDVFSGSSRPDELPSISLRQITLYHGDRILMANQSDSLKFALCLNRKDVKAGQDVAREAVDNMNRQIDHLHLTKPKQSVGLLQVL